MDLLFTVVIVSLLVVASGYFSGFETGIYSLNRVRHQIRVRRGGLQPRLVEGLLARPGRLISTMLVGNNIVNFAMTSVVTLYVIRATSEVPEAAVAIAGGLSAGGEATRLAAGMGRADVITTLTLSPFLFVFGEVAPKDLFRRHADWLVYRLSLLTETVARVLRPLSLPLELVSKLLLRAVPGARAEGDSPVGTELTKNVLAAGAEAGVLTDYQDRMARNVIALRGRRLDEVMIPARRVVTVPISASPAEARDRAREGKVSRMPVRDETGAWIGVVNIYDLWFESDHQGTIASRVREVPRLPVTTTVERAIARIRRSRQPMGIVASGDRAVGVVTIKDLVEEIVGELRDI